MARFPSRTPILDDPKQIQTGNQTQQTPNLPAVTNASIGKAVGQAGQVLFDIGEKAKRANDVTKLTEASLGMQKAQMDFATFQQTNPNEKDWLPKWQELTTNMENEIGQMELTPDARATMTARFGDWSSRGTINVQAQGFKQAAKNVDLTIETAAMTKQFGAARQGVQDGMTAGIYTPQEGAFKIAQLDKQEKDDAYNTFLIQKDRLAARDSRTVESLSQLEGYLDSARDSMKPEMYELEKDNLMDAKEQAVAEQQMVSEPEEVLRKLKEKDKDGNPTYAPNLKSPDQRQRLEREAMARIEELQMQESDSVLNSIVSGSVTSFKDAETIMPRSTPVQKAKIQAIFDKKPPTKWEAAILSRALNRAIDDYDPKKDVDDQKKFAIVDTINRLNLYDQKLTSTERQRFFKKQQGSEPPSPLAGEIANTKKFLDVIYDAKLKKLMDPDTKEVPPEKQAEYRELLSQRDKLADDFEQEVKNGTIKTRTDARNRSMEILQQPWSEDVQDYWNYAPSSQGERNVNLLEKLP